MAGVARSILEKAGEEFKEDLKNAYQLYQVEMKNMDKCFVFLTGIGKL